MLTVDQDFNREGYENEVSVHLSQHWAYIGSQTGTFFGFSIYFNILKSKFA